MRSIILALLFFSATALASGGGYISTTSALPALTGDVTSSAGTAATTAAATQANIATLSKSSGVAIHGTNTNDSAAAGYVGEVVRSAQTNFQNMTSSNTFIDVTSIGLAAGDWDVSGLVFCTINGATITLLDAAISLFSANTTTDHVAGDNVTETSWTAGTATIAIPAWRVSASGSTTVYLKSAATKSAGTPQCKGRISARRAR